MQRVDGPSGILVFFTKELRQSDQAIVDLGFTQPTPGARLGDGPFLMGDRMTVADVDPDALRAMGPASRNSRGRKSA